MAGDPFYSSKAWWKIRAKVKAIWKAKGLACAYCNEPLDWDARPIVDHIKNRKQHPELALELTNLQVLHHRCNSVKYHHVEINDKVEIGLDGYPKDSEWSA